MNKEDTNVSGSEAAGEQVAPAPVDQLTPEQIEELKQQAAKAAENWDRLLRTTADFDNYKKRITREKQEALKYANEGLLEKLLPVLDNFENALAATQNAQGETAQALYKGVDLVFQQFRQVLKDAGVEEIDARGAIFDPNLHEALAAQESTEEEGKVLQQTRKGYKLGDRLVRPASVVVAKAPATQPNP